MGYPHNNPRERKDKGRVRRELECVTEFAGTVRDSVLVCPLLVKSTRDHLQLSMPLPPGSALVTIRVLEPELWPPLSLIVHS